MLLAHPLRAAAFAPYGEVVQARGRSRAANMGRARRFDFLAELRDLRPGRARPNLCLFRCRPLPGARLALRVLERHPRSTQVFIPMGGSSRYLVVVALGRDRPDLSTLRAFTASASQGVSYRPGVWHHPIAALDRRADLACLVWEDGSREDTELSALSEALEVWIPGLGQSRSSR